MNGGCHPEQVGIFSGMPTRIVVKVDPEITVGSAGNFSGSGRLAAICALILCSVSQSGCFWLSDQLSAVGLHETKIDVPGNLKTDLIAKPMRHTLSPPDQDMPMYIPYTYFTPSTDGIPMEPVTVHAGEMSVAGKDRAGNTRYSFPVTIAGKMLNFDGT